VQREGVDNPLRETKKWPWTLDVNIYALYWFIMFSSSSPLLIHYYCRDDCDSLSLILSFCSFPLMLINVLYLSLYSQCIPSTLFVPTNLFAFGLLIYWDTFFVSLSLWLFLTAMLMATSISARNIILWIYCLPMFWFPNFCFEAILCALCVADGTMEIIPTIRCALD